ncbi:phytanoyl-CoA dioxygenase domain-containing protein 1-like [Saccoglossus kowalevskii]|uniref:Phytanoyl-CoA dioxygenase domain-containing protein 1-like n=1 Tax=Saccoglossus kowalevskii TaxID=10224 RepID=A0ABM0MMQ9_SACKO|nr:PREDICTED: phytanoyl-CoA dioxygenase domain-containing protein 1-like [Saccoglossus kowalevskii]
MDENRVKEFKDNGYIVVENVLTETEADELRAECHSLIEKMNPKEHLSAEFVTGEKQTTDDYFLTSNDKIRFFFEKGTIGENGDLLRDKHLSLNKIGHALHALNPKFKEVTHKQIVQDIARAIGFQKPVIAQGMYIFKQPGIGGEGSMVVIHGEVIHKSELNTSDKSRHIYTFHICESHNTTYSKRNWLQPSESLPFPALYTEG